MVILLLFLVAAVFQMNTDHLDRKEYIERRLITAIVIIFQTGNTGKH